MKKLQIIIFISLLCVIPIGFYSKFYSGPVEDWVNNSLGGLFYEIFWCLLVALIFTKAKPIKIAVWVFVITCSLEFLQLWHPPFLEYLRGNFFGRTILGNSFNWLDFPYYFIGSFLGYLLLKGIKKISKESKPIRNT